MKRCLTAFVSFIIFILEFLLQVLGLFINTIIAIPVIFLFCLFRYHNRIQFLTSKTSVFIMKTEETWGQTMPTFSYRCASCQRTFELILRIRRKWSTRQWAMPLLSSNSSPSNYYRSNPVSRSIFHRKVSSYGGVAKYFKRN